MLIHMQLIKIKQNHQLGEELQKQIKKNNNKKKKFILDLKTITGLLC